MDHAKKLAEALREAIKPQISEGIGAILRKFCDSDHARMARTHLHAMPESDWNTLVDMLSSAAADAALAAYDAAPAWTLPTAWTDVLAERRRQIDVEGWHPARDDMYTNGELALAGSAYAAASTYYHADPYAAVLSVWPWHRSWFKPTTPRRDLVKASALILAEIERLDRATSAPLPGDA